MVVVQPQQGSALRAGPLSWGGGRRPTNPRDTATRRCAIIASGSGGPTTGQSALQRCAILVSGVCGTAGESAPRQPHNRGYFSTPL